MDPTAPKINGSESSSNLSKARKEDAGGFATGGDSRDDERMALKVIYM
jgi:hypothetical protein